MSPNSGGTLNTSDIRNVPAYSVGEAARYLRLPTATLRAWVVGRAYPTSTGTGQFRPLIVLPNRVRGHLSFWNLIEAHVLRALRTEHGVKLREVRTALGFAEKQLKIDRLLLREELETAAGQLFLDRYGELINLSASGQIALRRVLEAHLKRVARDSSRFPVRLYPFVGEATVDDRPIAIDPQIAFGRPVLVRKGITTQAIIERIDAGESVNDLAADYDLKPAEIEEAVLYERAA